MRLLHAGVEVSVIALWLGHEQTETAGIYLHADLALKEKALARTTPPTPPPTATARPTRAWPSSKASDYADPEPTPAPAISARKPDIGITSSSA